MKKFIALVFLVVTLAGCAAEYDEALVGEWNWSADGAYTYLFNYDGTGERGFPETRDPFTWSTRGTRLNIIRESPMRGEISDEIWEFEIYEYNLVIVNANHPPLNETHIYFPAVAGNNPALVGEWAWDGGEAFTYVFRANGTGTRGFSDEDDGFRWTADEGRLNIIRDSAGRGEIRGELWSFEIDGDTLTITNLQLEDASFSYIRITQ